jgi:hypothetical protein
LDIALSGHITEAKTTSHPSIELDFIHSRDDALNYGHSMCSVALSGGQKTQEQTHACGKERYAQRCSIPVGSR